MPHLSRRRFLDRLGTATTALAVLPPAALGAARPLTTPGPGASSKVPLDLRHAGNPYGPAPGAIAVLRETSSALHRYPDDAVEALRGAIARSQGIEAATIAIGCGSAELLRAALRVAAGPGGRIVAAAPTCDLVATFAADAGLELATVPLRPDHAHDLEAMFDEARRPGSVLYVCNPNSPTGTLTRRQALDPLLRRLPAHGRLIVDEAYHEYVEPSPDYGSYLRRAAEDARVIVTRSFSKAYGLAGLRVGYAVATPDTVRSLQAACLPFGVSALAARAAAAALDDNAHLARTVACTVDDRQEFQNQVNARMLRSIDSQTNFVLLDCGRQAEHLAEHFRKHGILLAPPLAGTTQVRIPVGAPDEMAAFWRVFDLLPGGPMIM